MAEYVLTSERVEVDDSLEAVYRLFQARGWGDGLPIVPPTEDRVKRFLDYTDRDPQQIVATIPPRWGEATVEKIAINAVMAGCLPEYLPVVITAVEAMADPAFNLYAIQATTHPVAPLVILNGPIARELDVNSGYNAFGQGWRANATIGRAIRLILMNIGGGIPGRLDRATQGQPSKYTYCVAENEEANPWEPLHVEKGFEPWVSTVTVIGGESPHNINDHGSTSGLGILKTCAGAIRAIGTNNYYRGGEILIAFGPEHAETLARDGFNKRAIREYIFEHARNPLSEFAAENAAIYREEAARRGLIVGEDYLVPVVDGPESIWIIVVGGAGKHSSWVPTFGGTTRGVIRPIALKDGTPARSIRDFRRA